MSPGSDLAFPRGIRGTIHIDPSVKVITRPPVELGQDFTTEESLNSNPPLLELSKNARWLV